MIMVIGPHKRKPEARADRTPRPARSESGAASRPVPPPREATPAGPRPTGPRPSGPRPTAPRPGPPVAAAEPAERGAADAATGT
jgi:translation initiation factor IF-2